jgi:hypothetical protein
MNKVLHLFLLCKESKQKKRGFLRKKKGFVLCKSLFEIGAPEAIRTPDPFLRREVLYPAELRAQAGLL